MYFNFNGSLALIHIYLHQKKIMIAVVATDEKNGIGNNNKLLCHLPEDLKYFKNLTSHHIVVMGRKTYESIGKPLPNRVNIVISGQKNLELNDVHVFSDIQSVLHFSQKNFPDKKIFIIGGEQIYKLFYPYINEIHRTLIHHIFEADAFFLNFENDFQLLHTTFYPKNEKNIYNFEIQVWKRKI